MTHTIYTYTQSGLSIQSRSIIVPFSNGEITSGRYTREQLSASSITLTEPMNIFGFHTADTLINL